MLIVYVLTASGGAYSDVWTEVCGVFVSTDGAKQKAQQLVDDGNSKRTLRLPIWARYYGSLGGWGGPTLDANHEVYEATVSGTRSDSVDRFAITQEGVGK